MNWKNKNPGFTFSRKWFALFRLLSFAEWFNGNRIFVMSNGCIFLISEFSFLVWCGNSIPRKGDSVGKNLPVCFSERIFPWRRKKRLLEKGSL